MITLFLALFLPPQTQQVKPPAKPLPYPCYFGSGRDCPGGPIKLHPKPTPKPHKSKAPKVRHVRVNPLLVQRDQEHGEIMQFTPYIQPADAPKDAHEFAMKVFAEDRAYRQKQDAEFEAKHPEWHTVNLDEQTMLFQFYSGHGLRQGVSIEPDGTVKFTNITPEDALLLLAAFQMDTSLRERKRDDEERRIAEAVKVTVPPVSITTRGRKYGLGQNLPESQRVLGVTGDTNCSLKRVRILEDNPSKQAVVLHEMMHVATNCDSSVHKAIYAITPGLLDMLQHNPDLVKFLTFDPRKNVTVTGK